MRSFLRVLSVMFITVFLLGCCKLSSEASEAKSLTYDSFTDCFRFQSTDTTATSATRYQTIGFYITRCATGLQQEFGDGTQYVKIDLGFNFSNETTYVGTKQINVWTISKQQIYDLIQAYGYTEWCSEITAACNGVGSSPYYIKFDAIMVTKKPLNSIYYNSGLINNDHWTEVGSHSYSLVDTDPAKQRTYNKFSIDALKHAYGWADPASIDNHFNLYYEISGNPPPPPPGGEPGASADTTEWVTRIGKASPDFCTYNTSSDGLFDIGVSIPTTEHVNNGTEADQWYGYADIGQHYINRRYKFPYVLTYQQPIYNASNVQVASVTVHRTGWISLCDSISYMYIQNLNIYDLTGVQVSNGVYPDGTLNYASGSDVTVNCVINGVANPTTFAKQSDESAHVTRSDPDLTCITGITTIEQAKEIAKARMEANKMTATNDYLEINGVVVLDNNTVFTSSMYHKHDESCYEAIVCGANDYTATLKSGSAVVCTCGGEIQYINVPIGGTYRHPGFCPICGTEPCHTDHPREELHFVCKQCGHDYGHYWPVLYDFKCNVCGAVYADKPSAPSYCTNIKGYGTVPICGMSDEGWIAASETMDFPVLDLDATILPTETYETQNIMIPARVANGEYNTKITASYRNVLTNAVVNHSRSKLSGNNHIKLVYDEFGNPITGITKGNVQEQLYANNEPIIVHTPIISPFKIIDPETQTQLIDESDTVDYQLMLDGAYTFEFESVVHSDAKGYGNDAGSASRYDRYVGKKAIRFPFSIKYNGNYYNKTATGYTEWIILTDTDWTGGTFYIPAWAEETKDAKIQVLAVAINATGEGGEDRSGNVETEANRDLNNYAALFEKTVQLSGRMYGFQIVGINDRDMFAGYETDASKTQTYSFAMNKEEKKLGKYNRLGGTTLRYVLDKALEPNWQPVNTLPFCSGKSIANPSLGTLWKGTQFAFTIETIANLWSPGPVIADTHPITDQLQVTPAYRYVYKDAGGNVQIREDVDIYYHVGNQYIKMGSDEDKAIRNEVSLRDAAFDGSYTEAEAEYTKDKLNEWTGSVFSTQTLLRRSIESFNMSSIILNSDLRLLTGAEEEMGTNLDKESSAILRYTDDFAFKDRFDYSMQTWYGSYIIPSRLLVAPKDIDVDKDGDIDSDDDVDGDGKVDLRDYAYEYTLTDTSDVWLPMKGCYLVLNFDIKSVNEGEDHLTYYGSTLDMWSREREGDSTPDDPIDPSKPNTPGNRPPYDVIEVKKEPDPPTPIPIVPGDVAIIDLDEDIMDKYQAGIFMIN